MSKILITGVSGFVGSYISPELCLNHNVSAISRERILTNFNAVFSWENYANTPCDYDVVIHLAGLAHDTSNSKDEKEYFNVNLDLTAGLVNWINQSKNHVRLIYMSSIKVYNDSFLINEETFKSPSSIYGKSKLAAENSIINHLSKNHTYYILEPAMIYGIGNKGNLPKLFHSLAKGLPYPFSGWKNKRSILAIENLNFIITQLIRSDIPSDFFVVSDDEPLSTVEMIDELFKKTNKSFIRFSLPSFLVVTFIWLANTFGVNKLNKLLGNLEIDNSKIIKALNIKKLPFSVRASLNALGRHMEANEKMK